MLFHKEVDINPMLCQFPFRSADWDTLYTRFLNLTKAALYENRSAPFAILEHENILKNRPPTPNLSNNNIGH